MGVKSNNKESENMNPNIGKSHNENMAQKHKKKTIVLLFFIYYMLIINYHVVISNVFNYTGFKAEYFSYVKLLTSASYTSIWILLSMFIKKSFYKTVYSIIIIIYYFGQSIFYIYNDSSFLLVVYMSIPLAATLLADKLDKNTVFKRSIINLKENYTRLFFVVLVLLFVLPFFRFYRSINLKNLFLIDIYSTRMIMRSYDKGILGYVFPPLSRVVLPFLFVYGIKNKKKMLSIMSIVSVLLLFLLNGALKSIFFGTITAIFFIKGDYPKKEMNFLKAFFYANVLGLVSYAVFKSSLINDYMRRIIFVPASLFETYFVYFKNNLTYFFHSKTLSTLSLHEREFSISQFIGENVIGKEGLNANVGIFVEGFFSFGTIGVFMFSLFFMFILIYVRKLNFSGAYFGIFFAFLYIINTSFIETLMLTHGLLFLLVFAFLFFPKEERVNLFKK